MSPQTVRYALIGAGMMGREHLRNLALVEGSEVVALSDPVADSLAEAEATWAGPVAKHRDHHDLLAAGGFDALVVASPNDTHSQILADIVASGVQVPVLVEKPVCTTEEDLARLERLGQQYAAPIWVAMEYRWMPPVQELLRLTRDGSLGEVRMMSILEHRFPFLSKVGDWNRFSARTGGTLVEKCCHHFDLMRLFLGSEAVRVYASGGADVNHRDERYDGRTPDIIDNAYVVVDFANGCRAMLELSMFAEGSYHQERLTVVGDQAKAECLIPGPDRFWPGEQQRHSTVELSPREPKGPRSWEVEVDPAVLGAGDHHGSTFHQHTMFREVVVAGAPVEVTLADGLAAVRIGLAAERSARTGEAVILTHPAASTQTPEGAVR